MTIELTDEQRQCVEGAEFPIRVIDPQTNTGYVLLREDLYSRVQSLFETGRLTEEERRVIVQGAWRRAGWDDPAMDDYAKLDPRNELAVQTTGAQAITDYRSTSSATPR